MWLPDDVYGMVTVALDITDLHSLDTACRTFHKAHSGPRGSWRATGSRTFHGVAVKCGGGLRVFEDAYGASEEDMNHGLRNLHKRCFKMSLPADADTVDWKSRCQSFQDECTTLDVDQIDSVAYSRCRLSAHLFTERTGAGIYLEVEAFGQADGLFFGVCLCDDCVIRLMFAPTKGLVQEMWLEQERSGRSRFKRIRSRSDEFFAAGPLGSCFRGRAGIYLHDGQVAFFRRRDAPSGNPWGSIAGLWETSGFVAAPAWFASGSRLVPFVGSSSDRVKPPVLAPGRGTHVPYRITRISSSGPPLWPAPLGSQARPIGR